MAKSVRPQRKVLGTYHHGNLRTAMIEAAVMEGEQHGFETVSLASIAKTLGVSQPASYRHFKSRDELLNNVAIEGFRALLEALRHSLDSKARRLPVLRRISQAYIDFGLSRPRMYQLMFASHVLARADDGTELKAVADEAFDLLVSSIAFEASKLGRQRKATTIWAGLHGIVMLESKGLLRRRNSPRNVSVLIQDLIA